MSPYPVCCTAKVPISVLDKFLEAALDGSEQLAPNSDYDLAIVIDSNGSGSVPDTASKPPLDPALSPFIAQSVHDASQHVGGSKFFVVLDGHSTNEDIALLAARQRDGSVHTARITFDSAQHLLTALDMATLGFQEIQDIAASSDDGIYGKGKEAPQKGGAAPPMKLGGGN